MRIFWGVVSVVLASGAVLAQSIPSAGDLAARVQARYATVRDFTADFSLKQRSGLLPRESEDRGKVAVKKPDRMRWTFATGSQSQVVADGVQIYSYEPKDKYVQVAPMPKGDHAPTALLFLAGRGDITRDFTAELPADQPMGEWHLRLTPKATNAEFRTLTLMVDRQSLTLRGFTVVDLHGGTQTFRFSNFRENRALSDREFTFSIPKGVDIRQ